MNTKQQLLDLHKDIFLQSSTGYEARLSQALVDMAKGTVTSEEHVDVKLLNGTLTADRLRITGGGEVVRFEGNVVMNLDKLGDGSASGQSADAPAAPEPAAPSRQDALGNRQVRQPEMIFRMMPFPRSTLVRPIAPCARGAVFALALMSADEARAQNAVTGVPNAMQGFSQNRDQPIQIEAATLEMRDKKKEATFSGNVKVVQGDTTMTSKVLVVFYDSTPAPAGTPAANSKAAAKTAPIPAAAPGPAAVRRSAGSRPKATWS